jgi:hypothetical protein
MVARDRLFQQRRLGHSSGVGRTALLTSMLRMEIVAYLMVHQALKFQQSLESQLTCILLMIRAFLGLRMHLLMDFQ